MISYYIRSASEAAARAAPALTGYLRQTEDGPLVWRGEVVTPVHRITGWIGVDGTDDAGEPVTWQQDTYEAAYWLRITLDEADPALDALPCWIRAEGGEETIDLIAVRALSAGAAAGYRFAPGLMGVPGLD